MTVTLNIRNDAELRAYIKDSVKGQVLSIVREELMTIITDELTRKLKGLTSPSFDYTMKSTMKDAIKDILYKEHGVTNWSLDFIRPAVSQIIAESIKGKDWNKLVDDLAKEKVRSLIK